MANKGVGNRSPMGMVNNSRSDSCRFCAVLWDKQMSGEMAVHGLVGAVITDYVATWQSEGNGNLGSSWCHSRPVVAHGSNARRLGIRVSGRRR